MTTKKYPIDLYAREYTQSLHKYIYDLDLQDIYDAIRSCAIHNTPILVFGNGGSAAIAEHLSCDFTKGIAHDSPVRHPTVESLVSNQSLITAIANDYGYENIFEKQIDWSKHDHALAFAISSSGNSENIVRGLKRATVKQFPTVALVGFDGGYVLRNKLANIIVHVKSYDYGIVEDSHQIIMHCVAQQLRLELSSAVSNA